MLLGVDIGNTAMSFAVMRSGRVIHRTELSMGAFRSQKAALKQILDRKRKRYPELRHSVVCSVVPQTSTAVARAIEKAFGEKPRFVGRNLKVPIKNRYRHPQEVGQDRLLCAYAAKELYGIPALVIDFGTAITFDAVSPDGSYEGGLIIPGIRLSAESLFQKTALLPRLEAVKSPRQLIGKSTQESILSGLFNGYGTMCNGLIDEFSRQWDAPLTVVVTGGHTRLMKKYIEPKITAIDSALVYKGMYRLHQHTSQQK
jgi:type III pantothenate kinase